MNDYILKLKFTSIELPPHIRPESKDFPRARIRTSTPKCKESGFDFKSCSRPNSPKASPVRFSLTFKKRKEKKPEVLTNTLQMKINILNLDKFPMANRTIPHQVPDNFDSKLLPINSVLRTNIHSSYRVRKPSRTLNIPSPTFKIN